MDRKMRFDVAVFFLPVISLAAGSIAFAQQPIAKKLAADNHAFVFRDTTKETGLDSLVAGIRGHGAGWGDADGDGWIDLYVGTFPSAGPHNRLLRQVKGRFQLDEQPALQIPSRTTGVVFADLDNDGDLDLYVASMPGPQGSKLAERTGHVLAGCTLFRNAGAGTYQNISRDNGACPVAFGGRSVAALDYDGDGLLDLLVGEDPVAGYNGSPTASSRLFRNEGGLQFTDVSRQIGLPERIPGLGVAAADVNDDGWPDFFLASSGEQGNRLFLNDRDGKFHEEAGTREIFAWPSARGDNMVCGVTMGDVNRDGLLDIVLGQHFERPWLDPITNRLYLNRGVRDGCPQFEDVTIAAGLVPLSMKSPHVEIQDFDNDGWPDLYTSVVKFANGKPFPVIFRSLGFARPLSTNGKEPSTNQTATPSADSGRPTGSVPRFREDALSVNDFPTAEDKAIKRTGAFFDKMIADRKIVYAAPGPSGDYDRDGRLDLFLASWWTEFPSMLLHNETAGGNWLDVRIAGNGRINRMGIGSRVNVYEVHSGGQNKRLLGSREIATGFGYASGQEAVAHFGLGELGSVDVEVLLPHGNGRVFKENVQANQRITITP